jgi:hypothetical protein
LHVPTGRTTEFAYATLALTGDFNGNDQVELADVDLVLLNWGTEIADPAAVGWVSDPPSGIVPQAHLDKVRLNWGNSAALAASKGGGVPEPATRIMAVLFGGAIFISFSQRRRPIRR